MAKAIARDDDPDLRQAGVVELGNAGDWMPDKATSRQPTICEYNDLERLPQSVKALLEREGDRRFFNGLSWYRVFFETCLDHGQQPIFYVITSDRDDQEHLILPMLTPLGRQGSKISNRQLGPETCMAMTNYQTAQFGPITNAAGDGLARLLEGLARHLKDQRFSVLDFNHLDSSIPKNAGLQSAFERAGFVTYGYPDEPIVFEDVNGRSYADYMNDRSSSLRKNVRRLRKKLEKTGHVRFALVEGGKGLTEAIRDYEIVQKASWKADETYPDHVPALIRAAGEQRALRLGLLYLDDRPVATDLTIISDGQATGKKGHFDNEMRRHHVGDVLTSFMMEHLIDIDQVKSIDFGKTAVSYKLKWLKQQRPMSGFVAFDPGSVQGQYQSLCFRSKQIAISRLSTMKQKILSLPKCRLKGITALLQS